VRQILLVLVLAVLAAGCGLLGGDDIAVGDCVEQLEGEDGVEYAAIDCDRPHDLEVVGVLDAGELGSRWPGDAELSRWAFQRCAQEFETYAGQPYGTSPLDLEILGPSEGEWADGGREVLCGAGRLDGEQQRGSITD
jgi:hypothetical protein